MTRKPKLLVGFWDLSYSQKGDYKAFVLLGLLRKALVRDAYFLQKMLLFASHGLFISVYRPILKKKAYSPTSTTTPWSLRKVSLDRSLSKKPTDVTSTILYLDPTSSSRVEKHLRIEITLSAALFQGHLYFNQSLKDQPDTDTGLEQLLGFEQGSGMHDDFPDALAAALQIGEAKRRKYSTLLSSENYIIKPKMPPKGF